MLDPLPEIFSSYSHGALLRHNSYLYAKFQLDRFNGLSCALIAVNQLTVLHIQKVAESIKTQLLYRIYMHW
jgi:hypothetical protein